MDEFTVQDLVIAAQRGDPDAFTELLRRHDLFLRKLITKLLKGRSQEDKEDTYQEVCLTIFRAMPKFRRESQFSTFAHRICFNCCSSQTKTYRRDAIRYMPLLIEPSVPSHEDKLSDYSFQEIVDALELMPKNQRLVLVLAAYHDMSYKDIQILTKTSTEGAVKSRLNRARERIKDLLGYQPWKPLTEGVTETP